MLESILPDARQRATQSDTVNINWCELQPADRAELTVRIAEGFSSPVEIVREALAQPLATPACEGSELQVT